MWSVVGGLTTVIWSVVGCCSGRWLVFSQPLVGGRWFPWSVVGYFLGKWSVDSGGCSVVGVTVIGGGLWLVGGFCTTPRGKAASLKSLADGFSG